MSGSAPWHAHVYFSDDERATAAALRDSFRADPAISFVGRLHNRPIGPHPIPQFELHFVEADRTAVAERIATSGLRALVHPLTEDDLADHTTLAWWIGEPLALDLSVLDPPGVNQGVARFGVSDF